MQAEYKKMVKHTGYAFMQYTTKRKKNKYKRPFLPIYPNNLQTVQLYLDSFCPLSLSMTKGQRASPIFLFRN